MSDIRLRETKKKKEEDPKRSPKRNQPLAPKLNLIFLAWSASSTFYFFMPVLYFHRYTSGPEVEHLGGLKYQDGSLLVVSFVFPSPSSCRKESTRRFFILSLRHFSSFYPFLVFFLLCLYSLLFLQVTRSFFIIVNIHLNLFFPVVSIFVPLPLPSFPYSPCAFPSLLPFPVVQSQYLPEYFIS